MFFLVEIYECQRKRIQAIVDEIWKLKNCLRFECVNLMIHFSNVQICLFSKIFIVNVQFILFLREITL